MQIYLCCLNMDYLGSWLFRMENGFARGCLGDKTEKENESENIVYVCLLWVFEYSNVMILIYKKLGNKITHIVLQNYCEFKMFVQ